MLAGLMTPVAFAADDDVYEVHISENIKSVPLPSLGEEVHPMGTAGYVPIQPFSTTIVASGTMSSFPVATASGTAVWRVERDDVTMERTLYIGDPAVTGTMTTTLGTNSPWNSVFNSQQLSPAGSRITKIVFEGDIQGTGSLLNMFRGLRDVKEIEGLDRLNTTGVTNMEGMFNGFADNITGTMELDLTTFDTSDVTTMNGMFNNGVTLTKLDISGWDTSNVTDMESMFRGVWNVEVLNLSGWNTSNVTTMRYMFATAGVANATTLAFRNSFDNLDFSSFDTSKVEDMQWMFMGYGGTTLNLSSFNTSNVQDMERMFQSAEFLVDLDISNFDTSNVSDMAFMFSGASSLVTLNLSHFDTSNVGTRLSKQPGRINSMTDMFRGMTSLVELDISNFNTSALAADVQITTNAQKLNNTFAGTTNLRILHLGPEFSFLPGTPTRNPGLPTVQSTGEYEQWAGRWQQVGSGTIDRPAGLNRTSAVLTGSLLLGGYNGATMADTWVWMPRIYQITFNPNDGVGTMAPGAPRHPNFNENYALPPNAFTREDYTFTGWNTAADGTGAVYSDEYVFTPWTQASNMTLFAQWDILTFTVTYDGNGNDGGSAPADANSPYTHGASVTVLGNINTPPLSFTGHTFSGWNTQADGQGIGYGTDDTFTITQNTVLYAQWDISSTGGGGGNGTGNATVVPPENETNVTPPSPPSPPAPPSPPDGGDETDPGYEGEVGWLLILSLIAIAIAVFTYRRRDESDNEHDYLKKHSIK
ncbi:MAG: BspA family leucine-rich repeat surface protein [Methanosarcinales archaeon]|nr:BspA family leucine-rich repeat surface protein [Methanosarcinales archaeon]